MTGLIRTEQSMMPLSLKFAVRLTNLQPQTVLAIQIVHSVYNKFQAVCVVTSCNDSTHKDGSLHYQGFAADFRTKNFPGSKVLLVEEVKAALGPNYDVVFEYPGGDNEHLHVEYDPKGT